MQKLEISRTKLHVYAWMSLLLSIGYLIIPDSDIFQGLDGSFRYFTNEIYARDRSIYNELRLSLGPLIWLKWPVYINNHVAIAVGFQLVLLFTTALIFLFLSAQNIKGWILPLIIICLPFSLIYLDIMLIGLAIIYFYFPKMSIALRIYLGLLCIIGIYIKSSIAIPVFAISIVGLFLQWFTIPKKEFFRSAIVWLGLYTIIGMIVYKSFSGPFIWAYGQWYMTVTYSDSCNLYNANNYKLLALCLLSGGSLLFFIKQQKEFVLLMLTALYCVWKYSIGRQDGSHAYALLPMLAFGIAFILISNQQANKYFIAILLLLSFWTYKSNFEKVFNTKIVCFRAPNIYSFKRQILNYNLEKEAILQASQTALANVFISDSLLKKIGKLPVGVFPYELSVGYKYSINLAIRPSLQSGCFGRQAAIIDSMYWEKNPPKYILWHKIEASKELVWFASHENKLLQNEDGPVFDYILKNYQPIIQDSINILYEKKAVRDTFKRKNLVSRSVQFGQVNELPSNENEIKLQLVYNKNYCEKFIALVYKNPEQSIFYYTTDGRIFSHHITAASLKAGVAINRYYYNINGDYYKIKAYKITSGFKNFIEPKFIANLMVDSIVSK